MRATTGSEKGDRAMTCPACGNELRQMVAGAITVDVCKGGCGGIWFDQLELRKVDEAHESAGEALLDVPRNERVAVDRAARRKCPKCANIADVVMMRHFFSVKQKVEVDECPKCAGIWLDAGELATIRQLFTSEDERKRAAEQYFDDVFGKELTEMRAASGQKAERAGAFARMFRFICPSFYLPGKQDWGAF